MKLNKNVSQKMQIAEYLNGIIIITDNIVLALSWNGNSETRNLEAELNTI